jgi:hypothetical protein
MVFTLPCKAVPRTLIAASLNLLYFYKKIANEKSADCHGLFLFTI